MEKVTDISNFYATRSNPSKKKDSKYLWLMNLRPTVHKSQIFSIIWKSSEYLWLMNWLVTYQSTLLKMYLLHTDAFPLMFPWGMPTTLWVICFSAILNCNSSQKQAIMVEMLTHINNKAATRCYIFLLLQCNAYYIVVVVIHKY